MSMRSTSMRYPSFIEMSRSGRANFVIMKEKNQERQSSKKDKDFEKKSQNVDFQQRESNAQRDQSSRMSSKDAQEKSASEHQGQTRNFSQEWEKENRMDRFSSNQQKGSQESKDWEKDNRKDRSESSYQKSGLDTQDKGMKGSWEKENRSDTSSSGRMDTNFNVKNQDKPFSEQSFSSEKNWNQGQMSSDARKISQREASEAGSSSFRKQEREEADVTKNKMSTESERGEMTWATGGKMKSTESKRANEMENQRERDQSKSHDEQFPGISRESTRTEDETGAMPYATSGQKRGMESSSRFFEGTQRTEHPESLETSESRGMGSQNQSQNRNQNQNQSKNEFMRQEQNRSFGKNQSQSQGSQSENWRSESSGKESQRQEQRGHENQAFGKQESQGMRSQESQGMGRQESQGKQSEQQGRSEAQSMNRDKSQEKEEGEREMRKRRESAVEPEYTYSEMLIVSSNTDWEGLKQDSKPVILDFYKEGCGVCKRLYPKLADKAKSSKGKWVLAGADIEKDKIKPLARDLNVDAAPTVVLFFKGKIVDQFSGQNENEMNRLFDKAEELAKQ